MIKKISSLRNLVKFSRLLYARSRYFDNPYLRNKNIELLGGDQARMRKLRDCHKGIDVVSSLAMALV